MNRHTHTFTHIDNLWLTNCHQFGSKSTCLFERWGFFGLFVCVLLFIYLFALFCFLKKCLWHCVCDTGGHRCVLLCTHVPKENYCMHKTRGIAESFHWTQFTPQLQITLSSFINITKPWIHSWETFLDLQQSWEAETLCTVLHWERSYMYSKRVSAFIQKWPLHA